MSRECRVFLAVLGCVVFAMGAYVTWASLHQPGVDPGVLAPGIFDPNVAERFDPGMFLAGVVAVMLGTAVALIGIQRRRPSQEETHRTPRLERRTDEAAAEPLSRD